MATYYKLTLLTNDIHTKIGRFIPYTDNQNSEVWWSSPDGSNWTKFPVSDHNLPDGAPKAVVGDSLQVAINAANTDLVSTVELYIVTSRGPSSQSDSKVGGSPFLAPVTRSRRCILTAPYAMSVHTTTDSMASTWWTFTLPPVSDLKSNGKHWFELGVAARLTKSDSTVWEAGHDPEMVVDMGGFRPHDKHKG